MTQPTSPSTHSQTGDPSVSAIGAASRSILEDMAEEPTVNIDPKGDLLLEALTDDFESKRFRVCSRALRRQSPVWERMLFGPWKESKPINEKEWVVHLVGDPAHPLEIVLSIIHSKFDSVPDRLPIDTLHQLLIITNKYDISSVVRPWRSQWLLEASTYHLTAGRVVKSLYIAWELGDEHLFALRLEQISLNTQVDSDGRLSYHGFIDLEDEEYLGPHTALETISKIRSALLEKLISPVHKAMDARMKQTPSCTEDKDMTAARTCDAAVIGSIHREMIQARGEILSKSASGINESVVSLASWIFSSMAKVEGTHRYSHGTRPKCSPCSQFRALNRSIYDGIPATVSGFMEPSYKEYMAQQRTKTGLVLEEQQTRKSGVRDWKLL